MRRRVVRDLGTIVGVIVILVVVVLVKSYMERGSLSDRYEKARRVAESDQKSMGADVLSWELLRKTRGTPRTGPTFDQELAGRTGTSVNLVGFMVPQYEFRGVTEFLLLPKPIECYFCQAPPPREVVLVQMASDTKPVDIVKEPVLINGELVLNEGKDTKFFYVVKNSRRGVAEKGGKFHKKAFSEEHMMHAVGAKQAEETAKETLQPGQEPPKAAEPANPAPVPPAPTGAPGPTEQK